MKQPTVEQFLKDVHGHQMTVLHEDGLYRHLRFMGKEHSWNQWFELVTWPDHLTISGDMGTWTFSRVKDMFTFFRSRDSELRINCSYWAEKIQNGANGGRDNAREWDDENFAERLLGQLAGYYGFEGEKLAELTAAVKDEVLEVNSGPHELLLAARDFRHEFKGGSNFAFDSCELPDGKDYCYHFVWCLYAIVWGIQQWDAKRSTEAA